MKKLKPLFLTTAITVLGCLTLSAATPIGDTPVKDDSHPRILLRKGEEKALMKNINKDPLWKQMHNDVIIAADKICEMPLTEIKFDRNHKTMLSSARETLRKIFMLSYAYRMTGNDKYFKRAETEMLDKAALADWNDKTFLDAAEMSLGMAIGYDWLYDQLPSKSRETISTAIIEKGLKKAEALGNRGFVTTYNNWNQVCHAAMAAAGLATLEVDPKLGRDAINKADTMMKYSRIHYAPEGVYPEGPTYWEYGTSFNVLFLSMVEKYYGVESQQMKDPGFAQTGEYALNMITPSLYRFNYADAGSKSGFSGTTIWFYTKTKNPALLFMQKRIVEEKENKFASQRLFPATIIWGAGNGVSLAKAEAPANTFYCKQGSSAVSTMRANWDKKDALFVGFKAGSPNVGHGHMDVGEFVMEADGVRWSIDAGGDSYHPIETHIKGGLWSRSQNSPRWDVFRYGNRAHSTLVINGQKQVVKSHSKWIDSSDDPKFMYAVSDITPAYANAAAKAVRGVAMVDKKYVMVEDVITAKNDQPAEVRWNMLTTTKDVTLDQENRVIILKKNKKTLKIKVMADGAVLKTWSAKPTDYDPAKTYENPNNGMMLVGFEVTVPAGETRDLKTFLMPGNTLEETPEAQLPGHIIK